MKAYFGLDNPPVNIAKFAIGDGTVGSGLTFEYIPTVSTNALPLACVFLLSGYSGGPGD